MMRYIVFTDIVTKKEKGKDDQPVRSNKMKAEWVNSFAKVEKMMRLPEYIGYVPETRWCRG